MTLADRFDELMVEAKREGVDDLIHNADLTQAIMSLADILGYRRLEALDPDLPLMKK